VLSLYSSSRRVIVQGVYELYEKMTTTEWGDEARINRLVFIGEFSLELVNLLIW